MSHHAPLTFVVLGAGGRGSMFADWIHNHAQVGKVVAVAEPNAERRRAVAEKHHIPAERQFESWEALLALPRLADAAIDTLMDKLHAPSAIQAMELGYHVLLEKPMATTLEDCVAIDAAREKHKRIVLICHSLRYHQAYAEVKRLIDSGAVGDLMSFDAMEGVEYVHQSHSFVRGNWGNEGRSTFMLMSKSCHDMDIIAHVVGRECRRVSSFGSLGHFRKENAPAGAPLRCVDGCPVERECVYSALRLYNLEKGGWVWHAGFGGKTAAERMEMLKTSPYGRCVYHCDNDVVDHQVVSFEFDGGVTGTFTMTAFDPGGRRLRVHGTRGAIFADIEKNSVELHRFSDRAKQTIEIPAQTGGHGGADDNVMHSFIHAIQTNDPNAVLTGTAESLKTHKIAFAAELARREKRVVELSELTAVKGTRAGLAAAAR